MANFENSCRFVRIAFVASEIDAYHFPAQAGFYP